MKGPMYLEPDELGLVARMGDNWDRPKTSQMRILASILAQGLFLIHYV